jgi:DNA-binding HxlR family transcriptional regulator
MAQKGRKPVRGSKTGRPIMALLDLVGRRWTLRIIWELRSEALTSRALRERCDDISPTVLQTRLDDLREAGFVDLTKTGYALTDIGRELMASMNMLYLFAERWAKTIKGKGEA